MSVNLSILIYTAEMITNHSQLGSSLYSFFSIYPVAISVDLVQFYNDTAVLYLSSLFKSIQNVRCYTPLFLRFFFVLILVFYPYFSFYFPNWKWRIILRCAPKISGIFGKGSRKKSLFFSCPANKAYPHPLELSGHKKISRIFFELKKGYLVALSVAGPL